MATIGIIGSGAWGTALGLLGAQAGSDVLMWAREDFVVSDINAKHANTFLPGVSLPEKVRATESLREVVQKADYLLLSVSAQVTRILAQQIADAGGGKAPLVLCAKGIEVETGELLSEIVREILPQIPLAVLSGPGFAAEIAVGKVTAVTVASADRELAERLCQLLRTDFFRPYASADIITPQVCGSIKNVIAIAAGIVDGQKWGDNAKAALLTRALAEMMRFAVALGGQKESVLGLCGVGDLILTATSTQSRNYSFGFEVGAADGVGDLLVQNKKTVEGVPTAAAVLKRAAQLGVEMPLCQAVSDVLYAGKKPDAVLALLLARPLKSEG